MRQSRYATFYVVRHGETVWNSEGRLQGQMDSPLTVKGLEQARNVAKKLKHISFDAAFSSDLLRAKRTADIIALEHALVVDAVEALRERKFGQVEGKKLDELRVDLKEIMEAFDAMPPEERFTYRFVEDMESDDEVATRFITYLREIAVAYAGKTVLLVCHGGLMRAFLIKIGFAPHAELPPGTIDNTAYFKLESDGVDFFVKETSGIHRRHAA